MSPMPHHNLTAAQANAVMRSTYNTRDVWVNRIVDWYDHMDWITFVNTFADEYQRLVEERDMWRTMYEESSV